MKIEHLSPPRRGFTLLELLAVVTITGILLGVSIAAFGNFNRTALLEKHAREIINVYESAKLKARNNDKGGCTALRSYLVTITDAHTMSWESICRSGTSSFEQTYTIPLQENIAMTEYTSSTTEFEYLNPSNTSTCIIITDGKTNACHKIDVSEAGVMTLTMNNCSCQ